MFHLRSVLPFEAVRVLLSSESCGALPVSIGLSIGGFADCNRAANRRNDEAMMPDYIPSFPVLLAYSGACVVLFITPGPDMSLWLQKTISGGRKAGIAAMLGTAFGCCIHAFLAALGISVLVNASPVAFNAMKVIGAIYLLYLAWQALRGGSMLAVDAKEGVVKAPPFWSTFFAGLMINLSNPKVVLFFITFLPSFVDAADPSAEGKLLFLGLYFVCFNVPLSVLMILVAERFVAVLKANPRIIRGIDYVFAGVFGFFAFTILRAQAKS
jgi:threonine/homoserine/homoserine lactone efflux protein